MKSCVLTSRQRKNIAQHRAFRKLVARLSTYISQKKVPVLTARELQQVTGGRGGRASAKPPSQATRQEEKYDKGSQAIERESSRQSELPEKFRIYVHVFASQRNQPEREREKNHYRRILQSINRSDQNPFSINRSHKPCAPAGARNPWNRGTPGIFWGTISCMVEP